MRGRILLALTTVAALTALIVGLIVDLSTQRDLTARSRDAIRARLSAAAELYDSGGRLFPGAQLGTAGVPEAVVAAIGPSREVTFDDGRGTMWGAYLMTDKQVVVVRQSLDPNAKALNELRRNVALASLAAIALAIGVGWLLAERLSVRLRRAADVATRVAGGELAARVGDRHGDEVGRLATAMDAMAVELGGVIERERQFSANVAHDLRTPVQALVSAGELLGDGRPQQLMRDQVQRLRGLTEDLLEVFRLDAGQEVADMEVHQSDTLARATFTRAADGVELTVTAGAPVWCDRRRVERVLGNLLVNAERHGAPPITLNVDGRTLTVRDHGRGFADGAAPLVTDPITGAVRSTTGGLGLAIASRQAALLGAELTFVNARDGGAVATLRLAAPPDDEHAGPETVATD